MSERSRTPRTMTAEEFDVRGRRSFLTGLIGLGIVGAGITTLSLQSATGDRIPGSLRNVHDFNSAIWQAWYSPDRLAPTFDPLLAQPMRVNGRLGLRDEIDLDEWTLEIVGPDGATLDSLAIDDINSLPPQSITVEHKCVEGWSETVTWGGTAFANLAARYPAAAEAKYVNMRTPDGDYYVSVDRESMLHPQTMLSWELNNEPLTQLHGAPLRLSTPLKYGIKQIKRISRIEFSNERGPDYWTERGYDWYSGL